ncbi:hypothetical protein F4818DRAFT_422296 [Hypoxylon cercidicola]|nr:hypothetical protein F4818DRAFT_422296 [Hypoxylon cercidicola]
MMNHSSNSCIDPEQLYQLPSDSPSTLDCSPRPHLLPQQLPMESLDDPLKCYKLGDLPGSDIGQNNFVDAGYGTGSEISNYFVLPADLDYQGTSQPATDNIAIQEPRFERHESRRVEDLIFNLREEKPPATYSRRSSRSSNKSASDESGVEKRQRNRMAASKCRKKQKLANNERQQKARIISEQHSCLMARKASLEADMLNLKNELLLHGTCGDESISAYLMQTARNFVKGRGSKQDGAKEGLDERASPIGREQCLV